MELVKVKIGNGVYMKMEKSEAIKKGLYVETVKMRKPAKNKMIMPKVHKLDSMPEPDDFTEIDGIGKATDKALHDKGIHTLDELMVCDLSFLSGKAKSVIESWRERL